jgi:cyanophycinase
VLAHPDMERITLVKSFLDIPILKGVITDTHFAKRNRMGRLLVFLTRVNQPDGKAMPPPSRPSIRGIGVDQGAAVLLEPDGQANVVGRGSAYFIDPVENAFFAESKRAMEMGDVMVRKIAPGHSFNLRTWTGDGASYTLSVHEGRLHSTQTGGAVY